MKYIRAYLRTSDALLLVLCILSTAYGLMLVISACRSYGGSSHIAVQLAAAVLGLLLFVILSFIDTEIITDRWYVLLAFNVLLLGAFMLWGVDGGTGNRSWLRFAGIGIQPSEVMKVTFVLLLAKQMDHLRSTERGIGSFTSLIQLLVHFALMFGAIVVTSSDLGSALIFFVVFIAMIFAGGVKLVWFAAGIVLCAAMLPVMWNNFLGDYQKDRILAPYFPERVDPDGLGITWQARQSRAAIAAGGLRGQGYMQGQRSQTDILPFKHTDFIFSVAGEELGMIGCVIIILLLTVIILRCIYVGLRCGSYMNMLVCVGFSAMLTFQAFENIGMCLGLTPVIGITLPFFSYGGSSMVSCFAAMGIVSGIRMRPRLSARKSPRRRR